MKNKEYRIVNIRRGKGNRSNIVYAQILDENDILCVAATLKYCIDWILENV